ncbi:MAG: 50S ribosomal protein L24 [Epsilonproteobacteria bacterium]|nr:50S ribosomal protein L24 [Campylobacterota bacterium]
MPKIKTRLKKDDNVKVISGKEKGKTGKVISFKHGKRLRVIVENINMVKKHLKASQKSKGGIVDKEMPISVSNVQLECPHCDKITRIGIRFLEDGRKVRFCKKCNEDLLTE